MPFQKGHTNRRIKSYSGGNNPFYGKNHSQEAKDRISDYNKGKHTSGEWVKGHIPWNKGKHGVQICSEETRKKHSLNLLNRNLVGEKNPNWQGGETFNNDGYLMKGSYKNKKDKRIFIHRLVMEEFLNRLLLSYEEVHHINRIRSDNRIENLQLCVNHKEHMKIHKTILYDLIKLNQK